MATNPTVWTGDNTVIPQPPAPAPTWPPTPTPSPAPGPTPAPSPTPAPTPAPPITTFTLFSASLISDPVSNNLLYDNSNDLFLTDGKGYRSPDVGQSWLGADLAYHYSISLDCDTTGHTIGLCQKDTADFYAVRSNNGGFSFVYSVLIPNAISGTWTNINWIDGNNWVIWSTNTAESLYSADGGNTWIASTGLTAVGNYKCLGFNPVTGAAILFGDSTTAWISLDSGITWSTQTLPVSKSWTSVNCNSAGKWIALSNDTFITSPDDGTTWTSVASPIATNHWSGPPQYYSSTWYISTGPSDVVVVATDGVYTSTNDGATWSKLTATIPVTTPSGNWFSQRISKVGYYMIEVYKATTGRRFLVSPVPPFGPTPPPAPTPTPMSAQTQSFVATAAQTAYNLTLFTYTPAANQLMVHVNGVFQNQANYTETSSSVVTLGFNTLAAGDTVDITKVV